MKTAKSNWFEVDREGLREMHGTFPPERMVLELVQNAWDESAKTCAVTIQRDVKKAGRHGTMLVVHDDNPQGFRNLADAYTLFRSTPKRGNPTQRGQFNYGEKVVLSRAISAEIISTTGLIRFDRKGRHASRKHLVAGSTVQVFLPCWTKAQYEQALSFLKRLIPPATISFSINGESLPGRNPELSHKATLQTVLLAAGPDGTTAMAKTSRNTTMEFYPMVGPMPYLYEMGIPVCEISGDRDINILQKVPLSQDRTVVPQAFLQDIYAETVKALGPKLDAEQFGIEVIQSALSDDRIDPLTAKAMFTHLYGQTAAIQSHDADSDQEAARHGYTLVPSRTWGKQVNGKLRDAGVQTTHQLFGRKGAPEGAKIISPAEYTAEQTNFVAYVKMLAREHYKDPTFTVEIGRWDKSEAIAVNFNRHHLVFHAERIDLSHPVSRATSTCLHELAHCKGSGHDGVYDHEFERLVDANTALLARQPGLYRIFETNAFPP